ncbi:MAG TPA: VCBS repeat-containing protein [Pirellulaceae bacterium]|nr:VCBS repeat-containing protein [Pirellulaceae bacterium]
MNPRRIEPLPEVLMERQQVSADFRLMLVAACLAAALAAAGCWKKSATPAGGTPVGSSVPPADAHTSGTTPPRSGLPSDLEAIRPQVAAFCGDCHAVPPASSFAKVDWPKEVARAYEIYRATGRQDLVEPDEARVTAYFEALAPESLEFPRPQPAAHESPFRFRQQIGLSPRGAKEAGVSSLLWHVPAGSSVGHLLLCDMRQGLVGRVKLDFEPEFEQLASLKHPAILEPADLDSDGRVDYLVGELGSFLPQDHSRGEVVWLRQDAEGKWTSRVLARELGRVAHAVDGDFDGDGDRDVLVAEFGWFKTGKILLLKRTGGENDDPQFETAVVDPRHGASHLRKIDWDADGDLDFVALISQEHEKVELFLQQPEGRFRIQTVFAAADPNFGSSGIELVDLDGDGDIDVLYTNGDAADSFQVKPFHAVRWLENCGEFPFTEHLLTTMPGVYKAVAADFDDDGDLDVAAIAFPPETVQMRAGQRPPSYDLLVFLEQTAVGKFERHPVKIPIGGLALAAGDFDGDGDADLASGNFGVSPAGQWLTIWWNKAR